MSTGRRYILLPGPRNYYENLTIELLLRMLYNCKNVFSKKRLYEIGPISDPTKECRLVATLSI